MSDNYQKIHEVLGKIDIKDMSLEEIFKRIQDASNLIENEDIPTEVSITIDKPSDT
ncbi:hypothetical protein FDI40_gp433 [Agrobacterium phage Atu_ph07]|uniref:Uncharacterized protein n=1 Tax=Agrobacterium phage Atu_ph07 TaxID=2024264 RepID=A0A2L0V048_9CAUD|nr:hypothetical protein FDI40_gp433 [Agrobacterium phage Atu_ph07]AUZ95192.1 hypothetical protein [Agrobacterium phage Atu_ph07]